MNEPHPDKEEKNVHVDELYHEDERSALDEFLFLLSDTKDWEVVEGENSDDGIVTKFKKSGKNGVPISCSEIELDKNVGPISFMIQLINCKCSIGLFYEIKGKSILVRL